MATTSRSAATALAASVVALSFLPVILGMDCVYTVYVHTGSIWKGGTDSVISVEFFDSSSNSMYVADLTKWGGYVQGLDRDYFERGNTDIFSGLGKCLDNPVCAVNVTSDGSGDHHGWYLSYVGVSVSGDELDCAQHYFDVYRWLATDVSPYTLTAKVDDCIISEESRSSSISLRKGY